MTANPRTGWQARLKGEPRTTNAGRLALPLSLTLDSELITTLELVLDGIEVANLHETFEIHLRGPIAEAAARAGNDAP